jgi:4-alpha-glucanotransferase
VNDDELRHSLFELARAVGVQTEYWDVRGEHHVAGVDPLLAVLAALGLPIEVLGDVHAAWGEHLERVAGQVVEPVLVSWDGAPLTVDLRLPEHDPADRAHATLVCEHDGEIALGTAHFDAHVGHLDDIGGHRVFTRPMTFSAEWPTGYHTLVLEVPGRPVIERPVLAAPTTVAGPDPDERGWGVFAPLYALRREGGLGPHVGDLDAVGAWIASLGGSLVATLPLLATYLDRPFDPSPYTPVSRLFWNELYLDLERLVADAELAPELLDAAAVRHEVAAVLAAPVFPVRRQADLVRRVLAELVATAGAPERVLAGGSGDSGAPPGPSDPGEVADYARFRAAVAATGTGWHGWPAEMRAGDLSGLALDPDLVAAHHLAQVAMGHQLAGVAAGLRQRGQRLYLDLPVGVHADGYDTWRHRDLFARGMGTGAPPDDFFAEGQDWGFPPIVPEASRAQGHRHWRDCLRHHMQTAGVLRLDHVMGLHRLFWVPSGGTAGDGVYVHGPREELFAVLAIESRRHDCWVVGEDLGTVPDEIREAMWRHQLLGMHVSEFQVPSWPGAAPESPAIRSVASLDTHDTPPLAAFLEGLDIERRLAAGQLDPGDAESAHDARRQQAENLRGHLVAAGLLVEPSDRTEPIDPAAVASAATVLLGESDAALVLVTLEDLWGETEPQNVPGTPVDRPNWVHRFRDTITELAGDDRVADALVRLDSARQGARLRARPAALEEERP